MNHYLGGLRSSERTGAGVTRLDYVNHFILKMTFRKNEATAECMTFYDVINI